MALQDLYSTRYQGWNVRHFYGWYQREHAGSCSYSWVMDRMYGMPVLQEQKPVKNPIITCWQGAGLVRRAKTTGPHRRHREPSALPGMMIHQDGSTHQWIEGIYWDLIVTMEDATNEHYSMFFVEQVGTRSRFLGVRDVVETHGLFCSFYSDRGSHYWHTPEVGGKVDKVNLTQFGAGMKRLCIQMIAAYSPQARGRSERAFASHQGRLPRELA